jgi:hypothetical protein
MGVLLGRIDVGMHVDSPVLPRKCHGVARGRYDEASFRRDKLAVIPPRVQIQSGLWVGWVRVRVRVRVRGFRPRLGMHSKHQNQHPYAARFGFKKQPSQSSLASLSAHFTHPISDARGHR